MIKLIFTIIFFPFVIMYYMFKLLVSLLLGILRLIGFTDIAFRDW